MIKKVSNGFDTMFWKDVRCIEGTRLMDMLSSLTRIARLPYRVNLITRWVDIPSFLYPYYKAEEESLDHCLIKCPKIILLWRKVWSWWRFDSTISIIALSISDNAMGKIVHASSESVESVRSFDIFPSIQRLSKVWISSRCSLKDSSWSCWISNPRDIVSS
nr:hypothetical protein [Tanacetum cinerariifolium]